MFLRLRHLTCDYGTTRALDGLSLDVADGEMLVLMGPSGCGKTTALRLLAGLERPTAGTIELEGQAANDLPSWRRQMAFAFQRPALQPNLTVEQNLLMSLRLRRVATPNHSQIRGTLDRLGILDLADRYPDELSGGQQQRAALARALIAPARLLLLDEPFSHLDFHLARQLRTELRAWQREQRRTTILVTHDPGEALSLADRVAVLNHGRLQQIGTGAELLSQPANRFVAGFCRWPPLNLLEGAVVAGEAGPIFVGAGLKLPLFSCTIEKGFSGYRRMVLGLSPEDVLVEVESVPTPEELTSNPPLLMDVIRVERQAPLVLATLEAGTLQLTAVLPTNREELPQQVRVRFRLRRLHLFDALTGQALL